MRKTNLIKVQFWIDSWIQSLPLVELLFYLYLFTNESISVSGYYRFNPIDAARAVHTTYPVVSSLLDKFEHEYHKILYDSDTQEIFLRNYTKHNVPLSPSLHIRIQREISALISPKIRQFIEAPSPTPCAPPCTQEREEKKSTKRKEEERIIDQIYCRDIEAKEGAKALAPKDLSLFATPSPTACTPPSPMEVIIDYLNQKTNSHFHSRSAYNEKFIQARINQNFSVEDFIRVIDCKVEEWKGTDYAKYLRPNTLFHVKFESYLNQSKLPKGESLSRGFKGQTIPALAVCVNNQLTIEEVNPWKI